MLYRELHHSGFVKGEGGFSTRLVGWIEVQEGTAGEEVLSNRQAV
jgi:hypothetical protein